MDVDKETFQRSNTSSQYFHYVRTKKQNTNVDEINSRKRRKKLSEDIMTETCLLLIELFGVNETAFFQHLLLDQKVIQAKEYFDR